MASFKSGLKGMALMYLAAMCSVLPAHKAYSQETDTPRYSLNYLIPHPAIPTDTIKLVFIGDVMMHSAQIGREMSPFLKDLRPMLSKADIAVANMEFPLAGKPHSGYPAFSAPDSVAEYMAGLGVDVFLTANNHIMDKGTAGLERTLEIYSGTKGVRFTGTFSSQVPDSTVNPLIMQAKGARIAFINFTYGVNSRLPSAGSGAGVRLMAKEDTRKLIERARQAKADFIVALPHWGQEYSLLHDTAQEEYASWLAEEGADAIVGAHPHVVQDTCTITGSNGRKVPVIYSLGNAVSNMSAPNTRLGLAATITLIRYFPGNVSLHDVKLDFLWCTLPGRLEDNYRTVLVEDGTVNREQWKIKSDHDNMLSTLKHVKERTGLGK